MNVLPARPAGWLPPLRIHLEAFLDFDRSLSEALDKLEQRYRHEKPVTLADRHHWQLRRRPR